MNLFLIFLSFQSFASSPELSNERIIFRTNFGDIAVALYPTAAPKTSAQILALAQSGAYNGIELPRVIPNFIVQVSNVLTNKTKIPFEKNRLIHHARRLSLAHQDADMNSGDSSFSFLLSDAPHLDGKYVVFGEVVGGWGTLVSLSTLPRFNDGESPIYRIVIESTTVVPAAKFSEKILKESPDLTDAFIEKYKKPQPLDNNRDSQHKQNVLYSFVLALMFLISSVFLHLSKKTKMAAGLVLLSILVLVYGLVEYVFWNSVLPVSWAGLGLFVLVLVTLRLMSRFESL